MLTELQNLGNALKKRREEKRLSFKEIENALSIRMVYLQALEEGKFNQLISPVYAQGFLRKYANYLELDEQQLFQDHPHVLRFLTTPSTESPDLSDLGSVEVRTAPGKEKKWLSGAVWIGGSTFIVIVLWMIARARGVV